MKLFINVVNWEQYQSEAVTHRGGRPKKDGTPARPSTPEFFAVFVSLWRKRQYKRLPDRDKLALFTIWQLTAVSGNGKVPADAQFIREEGGIGSEVSLGELYEAGFITFVDESELAVTELPETAWGQPFDRPVAVMQAAEQLSAPQRDMDRIIRDMEILTSPEKGSTMRAGLVSETNQKPSGNQSETSAKPAAEVSNQIREEETRGEETRSEYGHSFSSPAVAENDLRLIVEDLADDTRVEMLKLARAIPRGQESLGRFVGLARAGATARVFADARQAYQTATTRKGNPGAWVCEVIEDTMRKGAA